MKKLGFVLALAVLGYLYLKQAESVKVTERATSPLASAKHMGQVSTQVFRAPASQKSPPPVAPQTPWQDSLKKLAELKSCYQTHACAFPETDPRSYELALGHKIKDELTLLRARFAKNPAAQHDLQIAAKDFMQSGDGFVQEEALNIFSELPPSQENLTAITEGLQSSPDPTLMSQALNEFQRYLGTTMENQVHGFLSTTIASGAQFSALTVSEKIQPFVNEKSYGTYEKALSTMAPGARAANNLSTALHEYRREQTGA